MAHDHRSERPPRRGRVDDTGGDTEGGRKLYYHLTLLAESDAGYRNLIQLASLAFLEGYYYKPRLDWELLERHHEGLIATTGCLGGHVLQSLVQGDQAGALQKAGRLQDIFGRDSLFVELQDHGLPAQRDTNPQLIEIARKLGAPLLATNDSHYTRRDDHLAHDALLCVQTGALMSDPKRFHFEGDQHYLKTAQEMRHLFREVPSACDNTLWIAERADVTIEFGKPQLPEFPLPAGGGHGGGLPAPPDLPGGGAALGRAAPARRRRPAGLRAPGHRRHGLQLVLPDRVGPDQARQGQRHPGRTGAGERGRLRGGLLPGHHRHGPHPLRPAVRALPQPQPHLDARHRHGLRLPVPGRDDPLRVREVRPRPRGADHHLLDHQGPGRGARRRPCARPPLRPGRPGGQGHAAPGHGPGHAAAVVPGGAPPLPRRVQGRRRSALDVRRRPRRQAGGRRGPRPGGAAPAGRDPRRRRGHHQGAADHLPAHPAQARAGPGPRRRPDRHPVRDARRRGPGPAQDGLPRAAQPGRHHRHRRSGPGDAGARVRHRHRAPRRRRRLRAPRPGRHAGRVPAGVAAHAGAAALAGARPTSATSRPSSPCTGPGRWASTCTTTTPTGRTGARRSATSTPTPRRSWPTPTA